MEELFQEIGSNPTILIIIMTVVFFLVVILFTVPTLILTFVGVKKITKHLKICNPFDFLEGRNIPMTQDIPKDTPAKCPYCGNRGNYGHGFCNRCGRGWNPTFSKNQDNQEEKS